MESLSAWATQSRAQMVFALLGHIPAGLVVVGCRRDDSFYRDDRRRAGDYWFAHTGSANRARICFSDRNVRPSFERTLYEFHTHVIPRLALLLFVLMMPAEVDRFSVDKLIKK